MDSVEPQSGGNDHRSFDCPWCGAIAAVGPADLGTEFECPECHKRTKLTDANTHTGAITDAPPDAPPVEDDTPETYGAGHRTFDCPWCGAISGVDPSSLGSSFECPECENSTRLTDENTRAEPVTEAAPDAPPAEGQTSKVPLLAGLGVLVALIVIVALAVGSGSDDGGSESAPVATTDGPALDPLPPARDETEAIAGGPDAEPAVSEPATPEPATPEPAVPEPAVPEPATPEPGEPATEEPAAPAVPEQPVEPAPPAVEEPTVPLEEAQAALAVAQEALVAWEAAHPAEMQALQLRAVGRALSEEVARQGESLGEALDTPDGARAFNAALAAFIAEDPARVRVAEYLVRHLDRDGVRPHLLEGWEGLNFHAPRVREILLEVCGAWAGAEIKEHAALLKAVEDARAALAASRAAE